MGCKFDHYIEGQAAYLVVKPMLQEVDVMHPAHFRLSECCTLRREHLKGMHDLDGLTASELFFDASVFWCCWAPWKRFFDIFSILKLYGNVGIVPPPHDSINKLYLSRYHVVERVLSFVIPLFFVFIGHKGSSALYCNFLFCLLWGILLFELYCLYLSYMNYVVCICYLVHCDSVMNKVSINQVWSLWQVIKGD